MNNLSISSSELYERIDWLIFLRWFAAVGVSFVLIITHFIIKIQLPLIPLLAGNIFLIIYNCVFFFLEKDKYTETEIPENIKNNINLLTNLQIFLDLVTLTYLIYFSGGINNPFVFFFIFHMVIASILLSNKAAYLQGTFAVLLLAFLLLFPFEGMQPEYTFIIGLSNVASGTLRIGIFFVISATLYITIYLTTTIVNRLRAKENECKTANEQLEEKDKIKSQYIQIISHDLKSSLAAIQSCLKVVLSGLTGDISEKAEEMISRAESRSMTLLDFVKELLSLSRIRIMSNLELKKEKTDLVKIVKKELNIVKPIIDKKNISLKTDLNCEKLIVSAVPVDFEHLFSNLISNAVKYTPRGGRMILTLQKIDNKGLYEFSIEDSGIGIPREEMNEIFNDFYRAENARIYEKDGTGLGLAIVKQIIDRYSGKIWVTSDEGKGTKFTFHLKAY